MALNFPINPTVGQVYTVGSESWQWNGHCWMVAASTSTYAPVSISQFPPASPIAGDLWWNSTTGQLCIYYADTDGSQWVSATQVPDIIATVSGAQVTDAFLTQLLPYDNIPAAVGAGINTGQLFKITGGVDVSAIRAVSSYDAEDATTVAALVTLSGLPADSLTLGTFNGTTIADDSTVKTALQQLETPLDTNVANTAALISLSGVAANEVNLGTFIGTTIADNSKVKSALQQLETKVETAVFGAAGSPTQIQFNQAGTFTGSADLTFNTGNKEFTVAGPIVSDSVTGTDTAFKTETGGVAFTTILNDGTAQFAGEVTTSNRVTHQRGSGSSLAVRFSPDNGTTFPASISAEGSITMPGTPILGGLTYPITDGTNGQVLTTDGSAALSWTTVGGSTPPAGADTEIQFNNSGAFAASNQLTFTSGTNTLGVPSIAAASVSAGQFTAITSIVPGSNLGANLGGSALKWNNAYVNLLHVGNYVLPTAVGTAGQVLASDGTNVTFQSPPAVANWTATLVGSTGNPGTPITSTGKYVKNDNVVTVSVDFNGVDTTGYAGEFSISGLPETSNGSVQSTGSVHNYQMIESSLNDGLVAIIPGGSTSIKVKGQEVNTFASWDGSQGTARSLNVTVTYIL